MNKERLRRVLLVAAIVAVVAGLGWFGLRKLDRTSSADYFWDSPDGRYRCAVFRDGGFMGGHPEYEAGLFEARWPHRELPGERVKWSNDSLGSGDFRPTWQADGIDVNFSTGGGDDRATIHGRVVGDGQQWRLDWPGR